jgi:hypothetical protein
MSAVVLHPHELRLLLRAVADLDALTVGAYPEGCAPEDSAERASECTELADLLAERLGDCEVTREYWRARRWLSRVVEGWLAKAGHDACRQD